MSESLPTENIVDAPEQPEDQGDWSLRANGDTYRDRSKETEILTNRLMRATASVTGIAGQRGSGKSSLALRVLDNCAKDGAFTQLIHSPTGYDSHEFLVSVFQRVCEEIVARIDKKFGQADSLDERGKAERRRLRGIFWGLTLGVYLLVSVLSVYIAYQYFQERSQIRTERLEKNLKQLSDKETLYSQQLAALKSQPNLMSSKSQIEQKERELNLKLWQIRRELGQLQDEYILDRTDEDIQKLSLLALFSFIFYLIVIGLFIKLRRIRHQMRNAKNFPRETGLRQLALELSEHLTFQTTHSKSIETGLWLSQLTSRFSTGKNLETRPLSLPGLTAQFGQFLEQISEVYSGRVVICLDELDKIENPRDLDKLLRGIKGVLGQPNTHFILTVSEDALSRFSQRRLERGMLESAFEDIIFLDRVNLEVADYVIDLMCPESNRDNGKETIHPSTPLLWLFGNAIPREIKRNALICLEAGVRPNKSLPHVVWRLLFRSRLEDMNSWAFRVGGDDQITYQFLDCLNASTRLLGNASDSVQNDLKCGREIVALWMERFEELSFVEHSNIDTTTESTQAMSDARKARDLSLAVGRAVVDVLLGASALVYVLEERPKELLAHLIEQLHKIFEFTPSNLEFSWNLMKEYLAEIDILELAEEANQN